MFKRVSLTNFQRHRKLEVTFGEGLVAIKGANEAGKSTLLRALAYLCFGASALAATLEETVTWGESVSTLRVEGDLEVDGVVYTIMRGKSGAQVDYPTGCVTGQVEVTKFLCKLLGMDAKAAPHLILSNQTEIRGALAAGAQETTKLIERLADFAQIDDLVELMQKELTLGSPAGIQSALDAANASVISARGAVIEPDAQMLDSRIEDGQEMEQSTAAWVERTQAENEAAAAAFNDARVKEAERAALVSRIDALRRKQNTLEERIAAAVAVKAPDNAQERLQAHQAYLGEQARANETRVVYDSVKGFLAKPADPIWAGSKADLDQSILDHAEKLSTDEKEVVRLQGEVKALNAVYLQGTCTFCGKDFSGVPEVAERNASTREKIEDATIAHMNLGRANATLAETLKTLRSVQARCVKPLAALAKHDKLLALADDLMPPQLKWLGPDQDSDAGRTHYDAAAEIARIQREQRAYDSAQAQLETLSEELQEVDASLIKSQAALTALPVVDLSALANAHASARDAERAAVQAHTRARETLRAAIAEKERVFADFARAQASLTSAELAVAQREDELKALAFNNELLKRVRAARPIVADRLWTIVLAAVSHYFSEMRGTRSVVTKAADGFKVDGHDVATLSGSTLDVLGLAIRVALVRTFLPAAQFLVLDEPGAGCDEERTVNLLGFVAACGFKQVLLVTHESVSEEFCSSLVAL